MIENNIGKKIKIDLQLFANGENTEDTANLNTETQNIESDDNNSNVEDNGSQQPELNASPEQQSLNKDNPANHAFAEMRRKIKEQEYQLMQQSNLDKQYADLAKRLGYENVNNARDFADAIHRQDTLNKYTETQDPNYLVEAITNSLLPKIAQVQQNSVIDSGLDKEIEAFNKEFKSNLQSVDDIVTLPNFEKVIGYMQSNNLSLKDAYMLSNPDKIKAATKQAAINQVRGNSHINSNSNGGTAETTTVTSGEIANWKRWFPGKTDEQCRKEIIANKKDMEA